MDILELLRNLGLHQVNPILQAFLILVSLKCIIYFLTPELQKNYCSVIAFIIGVPNDHWSYYLTLHQLLDRRIERLESSVRSLEERQRRSTTDCDAATKQLKNNHKSLTEEMQTTVQTQIKSAELQTQTALSDVRFELRDEFRLPLSEIPHLAKQVTKLELINDDKRHELNNFAKRYQQVELFCTGLAEGLNKVPGHVLKKYWGEEYRKRFLHGAWKGGK